MADPDHIVIFDGDCGLCSRVVRTILSLDRRASIHFTPIQSPTGRSLLRNHGVPDPRLDTVYFLDRERLWSRSDAALRVLSRLPFPWPLAGILRFVPRALRDFLYDQVAARRTLVKDGGGCRLGREDERMRFL